jgi:hypothetical protein
MTLSGEEGDATHAHTTGANVDGPGDPVSVVGRWIGDHLLMTGRLALRCAYSTETAGVEGDS